MQQTVAAPVRERQGFLYRNLVDDVLWERLVGRVIKDESLERAEAERIMDAGLGFVKLCAEHPGNSFAPTPLADIGWHTLILYTRHYAALCQKLAGRFVHHEPNDDPAAESGSSGPHATVAFMEAHGIEFDPLVWATGLKEKAGCAPGGSDCGTVDCDDGNGPD